MPPQDTGLGRGVIVLGMHRSGTSAVTGVIDALGLPACGPEDRMPPRRWNARGNFESRSISLFDERLLNHLGGTWFAPPDLTPGWAMACTTGPLGVEAARLFAAAHPTGHWVWKDPRACVLLPFWDLILGAGMPRVVVLRSPLQSAASLAARNHMPRDLALSLAERTLRCALRDSMGRPVLLTAYDELLEDLESWCAHTASFIRQAGLPLPEPLRIEQARGFVDQGLRHHRAEPDLGPHSGATDALRRLWAWVWDRRGAHWPLSTEDLPDESPDTGARLTAALGGA